MSAHRSLNPLSSRPRPAALADPPAVAGLAAALRGQVAGAGRAKGMTVGFKASIEFRQFIGSHTDTYAVGPMTVTDLSAMASGQ